MMTIEISWHPPGYVVDAERDAEYWRVLAWVKLIGAPGRWLEADPGGRVFRVWKVELSKMTMVVYENKSEEE
jgi:hypothetical protein